MTKEKEQNEYAIRLLLEKLEYLKIDLKNWKRNKNQQQIEIHKNLISELQKAIEILQSKSKGKVIAEGKYKGVVLDNKGVSVLLENKEWYPGNLPSVDNQPVKLILQTDK